MLAAVEGVTARRRRQGGTRRNGGEEIDGWRRQERSLVLRPFVGRRPSSRSMPSSRLYELTKRPRHLCHHRGRPAPDVGRAALRVRGAEPLDDLRRPRHDGLWPAGRGRCADGASGVRSSSDIAGEASVLMNMQEMSTALQYRLPDQGFHPQQQLHGHGTPVAGAAARRVATAESYSEALPDFVKLAEAYGGTGIRCTDPADLDGADRAHDRYERAR